MATPKRKRKTARATPNKRPYAERSDVELSDSEPLWDAERILDERVRNRKLQYLIEWKGCDPATGEAYAPSWEPKESPTPDLVKEWKQKKAADTRPARQSLQDRPAPRRPSRLVESSPEPSTAPSTIASAVAGPTASPPLPQHPSPAIHVRPRGSSFDPDDYERFTQLPPTQRPSPPPDAQESDLDSSRLFAAAPVYLASGVVPDSQSSVGEGSFLPATHQTTGTTQHSSTAADSQDDVTQDSGLLDIVQQSTSRAPSPAQSIPETIYDTAVEPQTLRQQSVSQAADDSFGLTEDDVCPEQDDIESSLASLAPRHSEQPDNAAGSSGQAALPHVPGDAGQQLIEVSSSHEAASSSALTESEEEQDHQQDDHLQSGHQRVEEADDQLRNNCPSDCAAPASTYPVAQTSSTPETIVAQANDQLFNDVDAWDPVARIEQVDRSTVPDVVEGRPRPESEDIQVRPTESGKPQVEDNRSQQGPDDSSRHYSRCATRKRKSQDLLAASIADHWEPGATVQPSLLCIHPPHNLPVTVRSLGSPSGNLCEANPVFVPSEQVGAGGIFEQLDPISIDTSLSQCFQTQTDNPLLVSQAVDDILESTDQIEDELSIYPNLDPESPRNSSPQVARQTQEVAQPPHKIAIPPAPLALDSIFCLEQNAQAVHSNNDLSTQDDTTETIWPTVEKADFTAQSSPGSRHDSSQDTPEPGASLHSRSSSPIGPPPSDSLVTQASNAPARPRTPVPTSSLTIMSTPPDPVALLDRKLKERQVERLRRRAERHATDSPGPATATPAPAATLTDTSNVQLRLLRTGPSPSVPLTEGTRSPSTVPDRFPAPQAPTSLRTVAHAQASKALSGDSHDEETRVLSVNATVESKESAAHATAAVPAITTSEATMADIDSSDNEYLHEVSDQSEATEHSAPSLLEEDPDLNLAVNERIIPLSLHGRQRDQYSIILGGKKDKLEEFLDDPQSFEPLTEIEGLLSKLRDLENHFDLIYEEASLPAQDEADNDIQPPRAVVFGLDNSVKFRFLWRLFAAMRSQDKHVLLVTQDNSDALYLKLEQLCRALAINYKIPTKNCQAEPTRISGDLLVTIFPSTSAPIIRPADLIICLDGAQEATQIRRKNWAINPKIDFVPIFHLVIPRTLGHIERCLSSPSNDRERMHTILACLAQFKKELGSPINGEDIKAADAATRVAEWLDNNDNGGEEWPLESIGSVAEVIEYVTQRSQESATPPAAERSKRPHEDEVLDPAKRMRFTPQPPDVLSSSVIENEVTRISDSMPGTATDDASILRAQLTYMESILKKDGIERQSEQARFQEAEIMWNRQQTEYEDLSRQHRLLQSGLKESNEKIDALTKSNDSYRERLATRTEEARIAAAQLKEERDTHLLSTDEKIAEITKLRNELAEAIQEKERAVKSAASANSTLEYTKDQYRTAQDAATTSAVMVASLEAQNARLSHAASAERTKLKAMHLDRQHMSVVATNKTLRVENAILKKTLANKEDELARAKQNGGRMGVGTRATSVTPQPNRVRSRAGSPSVGSSRLSNLRNG